MAQCAIQVAVRVRGLLARERLEGRRACVICNEQRQTVVLGGERARKFDMVFGPSRSQQDVYETAVRPLIRRCAQGFNATVLAYGQTGSGKTHTMMSADTAVNVPESDQGVIPRAIADIFSGGVPAGPTPVVRVSFVEIYGEELRDLLLDRTETAKKLRIREGHGAFSVSGLVELECKSASAVLDAFRNGQSRRITASTECNEASSRSHAVFLMNVSTVAGLAATRRAQVTLVDLAGSERVRTSGVQGGSLKETRQINRGLHALSNVILALSAQHLRGGLGKPRHVPYRDSKLTRILQHSLGGNAQTLVIACISPSAASSQESESTLQYASTARGIRNCLVQNVQEAHATADLDEDIRVLQWQLLRRYLGAAGLLPIPDALMQGLEGMGDSSVRLELKALADSMLRTSSPCQKLEHQASEHSTNPQNDVGALPESLGALETCFGTPHRPDVLDPCERGVKAQQDGGCPLAQGPERTPPTSTRGSDQERSHPSSIQPYQIGSPDNGSPAPWAAQDSDGDGNDEVVYDSERASYVSCTDYNAIILALEECGGAAQQDLVRDHRAWHDADVARARSFARSERELLDKIQELESAVQAQQDELQATRGREASVAGERDALWRQCERLKGEVDHHNERVHGLQAELASLERSLDRTYAQKQAERHLLETRVRHAAAQKATLEKQLEEAQRRSTGPSDSSRKASALAQRLDALKAARAEAQAELQARQREHARAQLRARKEILGLQRQLRAAARQAASLNQRKEHDGRELMLWKQRLSDAQQQMKRLQEKRGWQDAGVQRKELDWWKKHVHALAARASAADQVSELSTALDKARKRYRAAHEALSTTCSGGIERGEPDEKVEDALHSLKRECQDAASDMRAHMSKLIVAREQLASANLIQERLREAVKRIGQKEAKALLGHLVAGCLASVERERAITGSMSTATAMRMQRSALEDIRRRSDESGGTVCTSSSALPMPCTSCSSDSHETQQREHDAISDKPTIEPRSLSPARAPFVSHAHRCVHAPI